MTIGIIGRSEFTYESMILAIDKGHDIAFIVTSKQAPEYKYTSKDFEDFAKKINVPFFHDPNINSEKLIQVVEDTKPDICISVNYSGIISKNVISLFPFGILNAHAGDLPKYRGNACQAWAIINKEEKIGLCIHKMIGGELDSGNIIARNYFDLNINSRISEIFIWMETQIPILMMEAITKLKINPLYVLDIQSKNEKDILRTYPRLPEDGLIKWNKESEEIVRLINASSEPFSGAFTFFKNKKVIVWRAEKINCNERFLGIPGQISNINKDDGSVEVLTGNCQKIKILEVEIENIRDVPSHFIKSLRSRLR